MYSWTAYSFKNSKGTTDGAQVNSESVFPSSIGAIPFKNIAGEETIKATTYFEEISSKGGTYKALGTEHPLALGDNDNFSISMAFLPANNGAEEIARGIPSGYLDVRSNHIESGYRTTYYISSTELTNPVLQYSNSKPDSPYTTGNEVITSTGKQRAVVRTKDAKYVYVYQDIIPQEVKVTLATDSATAKNQADKERLFKVKVVLYRDTGEYAEDESYQVLAKSISEFTEQPTQTDLVNGKETEFNGRDGAEFTMSDGDSIYLQLPWGYRAEVVSTDAQTNYTTSYKTREQLFTEAGPGYTFTVDAREGNSLEAEKTQYIEANDINDAVMPLAANKRLVDQEIKVIKTRNAVPDDIGLFGGKANRAFLALVATLTTIAVAAYIYSKRYNELED